MRRVKKSEKGSSISFMNEEELLPGGRRRETRAMRHSGKERGKILEMKEESDCG